jgi:CRP/FNR family cyclic AMP-dependent transcriptional regulator
MTIISVSDLLRRIPLFSSLTDKQLKEVSQDVRKKRFKKGDYVIMQGHSSDALHIFLNGKAHVLRKNKEGQEVIISVLKPGDYVGEMSLIDQIPHSASVRVAVKSDVLTLKNATFARFIPEVSTPAHKILCMLVKRLRYANEQIESLALMDVFGRVARMLLEMAVDDEENGLIIRIKFSQQDMAKMVGSSREMVFRTLKSLEERGFIRTNSKGFLLINTNIKSVF